MYAKQVDVLRPHTCRAVSQLLGSKRCRPLPGPHQSARDHSAQGCKRPRLAAGRKQSRRQVTQAAAQQPVTRTKPVTRKQEEGELIVQALTSALCASQLLPRAGAWSGTA